MERAARLLGSNLQYIRFPLEYFLSEMERMGIRQLDFVPRVPHFFCSSSDCGSAGALLAALEQHHMEVRVLTPPPYRCSICAVEEVQRLQTERYYRNCIGLAAQLHCPRMVVDASGACWDIPARRLETAAEEMLRSLCQTARQCGVEILLAPVMGAETPLIAEAPVLNTAAQLCAMLERVKEPNLGVCLDTNIMSSCGDTIADWFDRLGEKTQLVRLADGNYHGWRAWGDGVLPMEAFCRQLRDAGYHGELSLYLGGERYLGQPSQAMEQTLHAFRGEGSQWQV